MLKISPDSYRCGQAEARLEVVPGLMPSAYVLGLVGARVDAENKKHPNKNKPGFDWVEDPTKKGGGYYRKSRKSSHAAVVGKVATAAVLVGAGAAAIAAHRRNAGAKPSHTPILPIVPEKPSAGINKKTVVGAGVGALALAGAGVTVASRMQRQPPQPSAPQNSKAGYEQAGDPWSGYPPKDPRSEQPGSNKASANVAPPRPLPPAKYQSQYPSESDPWKKEIPSKSATSFITPVEPAVQPQLPPAKPLIYKRQLVPKSPKLRQQINLAKREQTGLKKAQNDLELGQHLQEKTHSPADMMRGIDVEMNARERITNLKAKAPKRTPAGLATIRGKNPNSVRVGESAEESRNRKEKEVKKAKVLLEARDLLPDTESATESTTAPADVDEERGAKIKARQREERIENKKLKKELGDITVKTAGRVALSKARKEALNAVVPKLGDAVDTVYRLKGDKMKLERWASELEDAGNTPMSRRKFFRRSKQFVAKETTRKPKTATDELKRGVEVSKDFFDKVFDKGDKIILQGGTERMGSGDKMIQLSKHEFDRITKDYTHADRRALRSFLDLIKFPLP